jgi:hypothetical protein
LEPEAPAPNTTMWVALQQHNPAIEGDLGWSTLGDPLQLDVEDVDGFNVTWKGSIGVPSGMDAANHRLLITETETHLRTDHMPGDPNAATSPTDFVRSRIVFADAFEFPP